MFINPNYRLTIAKIKLLLGNRWLFLGGSGEKWLVMGKKGKC